MCNPLENVKGLRAMRSREASMSVNGCQTVEGPSVRVTWRGFLSKLTCVQDVAPLCLLHEAV